MVAITIDAALALANTIGTWIERVLTQRRDNQTARDAQILGECARLLTLLSGLDNEFHTLLSNLTVLQPDSELQRREELVTKISDLAHRREVIRKIRQSVMFLDGALPNVNDQDRNAVTNIVNYGSALLMALGNSGVTPFMTDEVLFEFLNRIRGANDADKTKELRDEGTKVLGVLNRTVLDAADDELGHLRQQILHRHPQLLPLPW